MLVQQAPHRGGRGTKLSHHLLQRPCLEDHTVHQAGPQTAEAELGHVSGGALLGGVLAWRASCWRRDGCRTW
jgi:hypothetical protein